MKEIIKKGDKFGRLTAVRFDHINHSQYWLFKCDCGIEKLLRVSLVKNGQIQSCNCLNNEVRKSGNNGRKHGMVGTITYGTWQAMIQRCSDKNCTGYILYGGRGITICKEWIKFENFYRDMGDRPENKTLDRIENNKGYYKENCHWATPKEQANNTRANHLITYKNKTQTISQWSKELEINYFTLCGRLCRGWSIEKALTFKL